MTDYSFEPIRVLHAARALFLAAMLGLGAHLAPARADAVLHGAAVVRDGDSLEIGTQRVRLWGVDAPEFKQTCTRGSQRWDCGRAARDALRRLLGSQPVRCQTVDRDTHGRHVARCSVGGRSVNEWLVQRGWAVDYTRYSRGHYAQAQAEARAARRGIWSGRFELPEQYRRSTPR